MHYPNVWDVRDGERCGRRMRCGEGDDPCPSCKRVKRQGGGRWIKSRGGVGVWFRPADYKPAVHLRLSPDGDRAGVDLLCNHADADRLYDRSTRNPAEVTCKNCLNSARLRAFKMIAFLCAVVWYINVTQNKEVGK